MNTNENINIKRKCKKYLSTHYVHVNMFGGKCADYIYYLFISIIIIVVYTTYYSKK